MGGGFGAKQIAWKHTVIAALLARRSAAGPADARPRGREPGRRQPQPDPPARPAGREARRHADRHRVHALVQIGAYTSAARPATSRHLPDALPLPERAHRADPCLTNAGPAVAFRAPGYVEGAFALESAMDELARALEIDPVELRLRNYADETRPGTSPTPRREPAPLLRGRQEGTGDRRPPRTRGIGFAAHDGWGAPATRRRLRVKLNAAARRSSPAPRTSAPARAPR